jgi:hypothetical protein
MSIAGPVTAVASSFLGHFSGFTRDTKQGQEANNTTAALVSAHPACLKQKIPPKQDS